MADLKRPRLPTPDEKQEALEAQEREWHREATKRAAAWKAKWPKHCPDCGGHGGSTFYQSHPYGSGSASEQLFDPCHCTMDAKCARCGEPGLNEDGEGPCYFCGWNYDDGCPEC